MLSSLSFSGVVGGIQRAHSTEGRAILRSECCANAAPVTDGSCTHSFVALARSFTDGQAFLESAVYLARYIHSHT